MASPVALDPAVGGWLAGAFALLFGLASVHKLRDLRHFAQVFSDYGVLPFVSRWRLAWSIPVLEALIAAALLSPPTRALGALLGGLLLVGYATAIAINLRAGRTAIECGCGAVDSGQRIAPWMVGRNLLIAAALMLCLLPRTPRTLEWTDAVTIVFGCVAAALLYASSERLLALPRRTRTLSTPSST